MTARTARRLAVFAFLVYALTGGGRIVGSDEVAMLELSRAMLAGRLEVPRGATLDGPDGRSYTKGAAAQALLALPLVVAADAVTRALPLDPPRRALALRFVVSFFNAAITAVLLGVFYAIARGLGARPGGALAGALLLGFTTPLWVYAKSFMAEPLQALGLLLALAGAARAGEEKRSRPSPEVLAGLGAFLAISVKLSMLPVAGACLLPVLLAPPRRWVPPLAGVLLALAGHGVYNAARFGTPFETGYGSQATAAAYTTPILVGLFGLLLSSGKGVMWFAPALWLVPAGIREMLATAREAAQARALGTPLGLAAPAGRAAWGAVIAWLAGLLLYARFQHWAGDGSFGPRYLVPLLPLAFLPVAFALGPRGALPRARRVAAALLGLAGLIVQIGGVGIYFGAQMREAGDYPYTLPLEHPRFMSDSHFNPAFSPIAGHWRMLARNAGEHVRGEAPRIGAGAEPGDARLGLSPEDQKALLHAIDLWWLYLGYAGLPRAPVIAAVVVLLALAVLYARRLARAYRAEAAAA